MKTMHSILFFLRGERALQFSFFLGIMLFIEALSSPAQNLVQDPSFENGTINGGQGFEYGANDPYVTPAGSGWSFSNNAGLIDQTDSGAGFHPPEGGAQSGSQFALLQAGNSNFVEPDQFFELDTVITAASTISFSTGVTYELSFFQATRQAFNGALTYSVKLSNDQTLFSRTTATGEDWVLYTQQFTVSSSGDYNLMIVAAGGQSDNTAFFDSLSIVAVPEPAGFAMLFGFGLAAFAGWRGGSRAPTRRGALKGR